MKISDLFESKTIILEARHDDIFDNHFKRSLNTLEGIEGTEDAIKFIQDLDAYYERVKSLATFKNFNPMWKVFYGELCALQILNKVVEVTNNGKDKQRAQHILQKNPDFKVIDRNGLDNVLHDLEHYSGINYPPLQETNPYNLTGSFLEALKELEETYVDSSQGGTIVHTGNEKLLVKVGEYGWYDIGKSYCEEEGEAMHHCGNEVGKRRTTDRILSLRSHVSGNVYKPHLTFILDSNGFLGEMKGYGNSKPAKKYHNAIIALLKLDIIKGIKAGGYKPENNFSLDDLTQSQLEDLKKSKGKDWDNINMVLSNPKSIKDIENPTEKLQLAAVSKNGRTIQYIKNPTEQVQLAAVTKNGNTIHYIKNPSEKVQLAAVTQNGNAIEYIKNPSEKVQLAAVTENGYAIEYIKDPSEEVQLAVVSQDGSAIQYIIDKGIVPTEQVQLAAVSDYGYAIKYIIDKGIVPTEQVQLAAVSKNGNVIRDIINKGIVPSEKVQLAAVSDYGYAIKLIINKGIVPTEQVQLAAVSDYGYAIQYIINKGIVPSEQVQLAAVSDYGYAIKLIINKGIVPTEQVQLAAVSQDGNAIEYIENPSPKAIKLHKELWGEA